jgi:hypothetical protein
LGHDQEIQVANIQIRSKAKKQQNSSSVHVLIDGPEVDKEFNSDYDNTAAGFCRKEDVHMKRTRTMRSLEAETPDTVCVLTSLPLFRRASQSSSLNEQVPEL